MLVQDLVQSFVDLGLTELEAQIYVHLLQRNPTTGYKIARAIGRSNTNTYKAVVTLEAKGAITIEKGEPRLCRPVPPDELIRKLEESFQEKRSRAGCLIRELLRCPQDPATHRVRTLPEVMECACRMLRDARVSVLMDAFPEPPHPLREEIHRAYARGVDVVLRSPQPIDLPGLPVVVHSPHSEARRLIRQPSLSLLVDGSQFLIAILSRSDQTVKHAAWSTNPLLAFTQYAYASGSFLLTSLLNLLESGAEADDLKRETRRWMERFPLGQTPGSRILQSAAESKAPAGVRV